MAIHSDDDASLTPLEAKALSSDQKILGLSPILWRLALVTGVGQFAYSIWGWQFAIYLWDVLDFQWQLGVTFSVATIATLLGFPLSGFISDMFGRRKTMAFAFIPMIAGLFLIATFPVWPLIPLFYAMTSFGWSFVLIITRAAPADEIARDGGDNSARVFVMVLMPAFLIDGLSPLLAGVLIYAGMDPRNLLILGALGACVAFVAAVLFVKESLHEKIQTKARAGPKISLRKFGRNFWILAAGSLGCYFTWNMPLVYLGNLITIEWLVDLATYGIVYSAFSFTGVALMYTVTGKANKNLKPGLLLAFVSNYVVVWALGVGVGVYMLIGIYVLWAVPIMILIGTERTLVVADVDEEMKGRALGVYQVLMSATNIFAAPVGAWIWATSGSLRYLFQIGSLLGFISLIGLALALYSMKSQRVQELGEEQVLS